MRLINFEMSKFLLLLGASGVGKSTIINELKKLDPRFVYISPFMTRPLREGEDEKVSVDKEVFKELEDAGKFVIVNELYGISYGTPYEPIVDAFDSGNFPVLDFPISRLDVVKKIFPGQLYIVYVYPPSLEILRERLKSRPERMRESEEEIERMGESKETFELSVVNHEGHTKEVAETIYRGYLESLTKESKE